jgi:phosphonate transport system ATP-binding protein
MALELRGVTRRFGHTLAVDAVDLQVAAGQFLVVIGPSGAGKSTLLRLVNRLVEPSRGTIWADDVEITALRSTALRRWRSEAAMIFQHFNLAPRLDVLTNVLVGRLVDVPAWRSALRLFTREEKLGALRALDELGLADKAFERAERLSGGQQQRVAIARALLRRPRYILADEPVAALDPRNAETVMDTLHAISRTRGIGVLCNLHDVELARRYADRVVALRAGRLVFDDGPEALSARHVEAVYAGEAEVGEALDRAEVALARA